jgi:glycolate oxidase iron-sulfur subunit
MVDPAKRIDPTRDFVDFEKFLDCVHCGLCLPACPTYLELGTEMDSPRGRIHLMRSLHEGRVEINAQSVKHLDLCLGCRACETACPSGVHYGDLIEAARPFIEANYKRPVAERLKRRAVKRILTNIGWINFLGHFLRIAGALGIGTLSGVNWLPRRWRYWLSFVPERPRSRPRFTATEKNAPLEKLPFRVGLLSGCVMPSLFRQTQDNTVRLLRASGCQVLVPERQACCGALLLHNGDKKGALNLARRNVTAFNASAVDAIVTNAAGCGAMMKQYGELLEADVDQDQAAQVAGKVRDIVELLAERDLAPKREIKGKITYHDACHLLHAQNVREQPRRLLRRIPGLELIELPESDICCGSAGTYNLTEPDLAQRLVERKIKNILSTGARVVATGNPGCMLQIQAGLRRERLPIQVLHTVDLLAQAYL